MDRSNIEKISQDPEDRLLLAKIWDKIQNGMHRNIPAATGFLSPREQEMARYLFGQQAELVFFGGYPEAERKSLLYLPDYLEEDFLTSEDSPVVCVEGSFYAGDCLTHRDILGSLIGAGVQRQAIGDIAVGDGCFFVFVTAQMAPFILQNLTQAGRVHLSLRRVSLGGKRRLFHRPLPGSPAHRRRAGGCGRSALGKTRQTGIGRYQNIPAGNGQNMPESRQRSDEKRPDFRGH